MADTVEKGVVTLSQTHQDFWKSSNAAARIFKGLAR
jgi:hypothetical protein